MRLKTSGANVADTLAARSTAESAGAALADEMVVSATGGDGGDGGVGEALVMTSRHSGQCGVSSTSPAHRSMAQVPQKLLWPLGSNVSDTSPPCICSTILEEIQVLVQNDLQ